MDIPGKCAAAARAIKFISTHDDAPAEVVDGALDALAALIASEKEASAARRQAVAEDSAKAIAAALK